MSELLLRRRNLLMKKQEEELNIRAVCFKADGEQTVAITKVGSAPTIKMQYSYDGVTWDAWDLTPLPFGGNTKVYVRGMGNYAFGKDNSNYNKITFGTDSYVYVSGIAEALLDGENEVLTCKGSGALRNLFYNQPALRSAENLKLETTTVPSAYRACYAYAFAGCKNLLYAPKALSIESFGNGNDCAYMFQGCTSLLTAPELPATTLSQYCYQYMFQGCKSLVNAPKMGALSIGLKSCEYMFSGCTSLVNVPALPLATLGNNCYQFMFQGCTSLVKAPELPSTKLTEGCYAAMFLGCTGLVSAPKLPATTMAFYCYSQMFRGCKSLVNAPELTAQTLVERCYNYMFEGCSSLKTIRCRAKVKATSATYFWLDNVSASGTFYGHSEYGYSSGASGIPTTWAFEELTD